MKLVLFVIGLSFASSISFAGEPSEKCLAAFKAHNAKTNQARSCTIDQVVVKKSSQVKDPIVCSDGGIMYDEANDIFVEANAISGNWSHGTNIHDESAKRLEAYVDMNFSPIKVLLKYAKVGWITTKELGTFELSCD